LHIEASPVHGLPECTVHAPAPSQVSVPLQKTPSSHAVPGDGSCAQPAGPQLSAVQGLPSSQASGTHVPPQQISVAGQVLVRTHELPSQLACSHPLRGMHVSGEQTSYSQPPVSGSQRPPGPAVHRESSGRFTHLAPVQVSTVQSMPSSQPQTSPPSRRSGSSPERSSAQPSVAAHATKATIDGPEMALTA
jgi:hypothetical protein